jgi:hypothetical protein
MYLPFAFADVPPGTMIRMLDNTPLPHEDPWQLRPVETGFKRGELVIMTCGSARRSHVAREVDANGIRTGRQFILSQSMYEKIEQLIEGERQLAVVENGHAVEVKGGTHVQSESR